MSFCQSHQHITCKISIKDLKITVYLDPTYKTTARQSNSILQSARQLHFHLEHEIFFLTAGDLNVFFDNSFHTYKDGIIIIPALTPHFSISEPNNHRILIKIDNEKSNLFKQIDHFFRHDKISEFNLNEDMLIYLQQLDKALTKECVKEEEIRSLLTLIFVHLLDCFGIKEKIETTADNETSQYLRIIDQIINSEFDKNINMQYLSNKLFLSTRQVARIIKKNYNCSLSNLIAQKKLSVSCLLLSKTDLPISKIISYINFETPNYFYTLFKKSYGITPLQYRKSNKDL